MKVYKLTFEESSLLTTSLGCVMAEIENNSELDTHFDIDVIEMTAEEINNLPEFSGFN